MEPKILLLYEVLEHIFKPGEHCLFGKRNFVTIENQKYDFYFHSIGGIKPEDLHPTNFAMLPVLDYHYPRQERDAKIHMAELYKGKNLEVFALRDEGDRITETNRGGTRVAGNLKLYSANKNEAGIEISGIKDCGNTTNELMEKFLPKWKEVKLYMDLERMKIEKEQKG
jgi:hypothetical protein